VLAGASSTGGFQLVTTPVLLDELVRVRRRGEPSGGWLRQPAREAARGFGR
jgi:hypothetical protein